MAVIIDPVRSAFSKMLNGDTYNRFPVPPEEEGGGHVEVKLSSDLEDDHDPSVTQQSESSSEMQSSYRPRPQENYRRACYFAVGALLVFIVGYLIGYAVQPHVPMTCETEVGGPTVGGPEEIADEGGAEEVEEEVEELDWSEVTNLLGQKLTPEAFDKRLGDFEMTNHEAGSDGDRILGNRVFDGFKSLEMKPWTDVHYVQLQTQDSGRPNRILIGSEEVGRPKGYLAYSRQGCVQGKVVYGNYGRKEDLSELQTQNVELKDRIVLLRAGNISFAQQVFNAAQLGASAVLMYPDPHDYDYQNTTELYGHVHLGTGDPYTPGFPSFNHTLFPPTQSSGLPSIPAQTITAQTASSILRKIGGPEAPASFQGGLRGGAYRLGGASDGENVTVEVFNVLVDREIHNVFGVIEGLTDPDRFVVLGAQRDAWGPGYAKATVGTTLLMELARAVFEMKKDGFRPRRSLVFASWSAGEYGSVGATEWLEGYLSSLSKKAVTYISLDGVVTGHGTFKASASPLLYTLLGRTMKGVRTPIGFGQSEKSLYDQVSGGDLQKTVLRPMQLGDPAYPFLAFSGIPSLSFSFTSEGEDYPYYGTSLDNKDHLGTVTGHRLSALAVGAGQVAGQLALRLVRDHLLALDVSGYKSVLSQSVRLVNQHLWKLSQAGGSKSLSGRWLNMAVGSYSRAVDKLNSAKDNSDLRDPETCRILNDRIMGVEHNLLSPYVSPTDTPFRHLLVGCGDHTLAALLEAGSDGDQLHTQLALATWTVQGCANSLVGNIWDLDNQI